MSALEAFCTHQLNSPYEFWKPIDPWPPEQTALVGEQDALHQPPELQLPEEHCEPEVHPSPIDPFPGGAQADAGPQT
jgi:hypothetical protein